MSGFEIELPSSPDPLADESIAVPPSSAAPPPPSTTRRVLQSAVSSRFSAIPGTSPRKRMFALDVGNEIAPQTIYVTVEAGLDGSPVTRSGGGAGAGTNVRRRLFGSPTPQPTPRRAVRTTTTTVPLRGLTDDEGGPTPQRRRRSSGRPGTPATGGVKRKKKGTPTPKATRKPRATRAASNDALQSETPAVVDKPTPARRKGRPPKRKADDAPQEHGSGNPPEASAINKQGRKRQKSVHSDGFDELTTADIIGLKPQIHDRPPQSDLDATQDVLAGLATGNEGDTYHDGGDDEDIFLAQVSDPPPVGQPSSGPEHEVESLEPARVRQFERQNSQLEDDGPPPGERDDYAPMVDFDDRSDLESHQSTPPSSVAPIEQGTLELEDQGPLPGEPDTHVPILEGGGWSDGQSDHRESMPKAPLLTGHDPLELEDQGPLPGEYAPMMDFDDRSDVESHGSYQIARSEDAAGNTIDPETFTMIGIETMPSFQGNRDAPTSDLPEIGETTSLFINKTLESLRQDMSATDEDDDELDLLGSREQTPEVAESKSPHDIPSRRGKSSPQRRPPVTVSRAERSYGNVLQNTTVGLLDKRAILEPLHDNRQSPAQRIRIQDNSSVSGSSADGLNAEDSFSDIPDDVLAAVEPRVVPRPSTTSSEDELTMAVEIAQDAAASTGYSHEPIPPDPLNNGLPENAHSQPPTHRGRNLADNGSYIQRSASSSVRSVRRSSLATQKSSLPQPVRSCSDSNRLLTPPDETTSPNDQKIPANNHLHEEQGGSADPDEDIGSSPPEITAFDQEGEQPMESSRQSSETPANRPPSIHLQPVQARVANAAVFASQPAGSRPVLSPIVRVGERLQSLLSDPPSPSARSSVLGSPFKGSVRKSSPLDGQTDEAVAQKDSSSNATLQNPTAQTESLTESPKNSWAQSFASLSHLKDLVAKGAQRLALPQINVAQTWEDPFGPSSPTKDRAGRARNSAFMDRIRQAHREGSAHSSRDSLARATLEDGEERSLSDEPAPSELDSTWKGENLQISGPSGSEVTQGQRYGGLGNGYDGVDDEEPDAMLVDRPPEEPRTDDTLLQPVEDQPVQDLPLGSEKPQHALQHDDSCQAEYMQGRPDEDAMQLDDAPTEGDGSDEDDVWAIEADRTASSPTAQRRANESTNESFNAFARSGLSVDWGTRSTVSNALAPGRSPSFRQSVRNVPRDEPENLEDYSLLGLHGGTSNQPSATKPTPEAKEQPKKADLSDFFSSSPNFIERERRARASLTAGPTAQATAADHPARTTSPLELDDARKAQSPQISSDRLSTEPPSPTPVASQRFVQDTTGHLSSTTTPEQPRLTQQRLVTHPSQNDAALFETWEVSSSRAPTERLYLTDLVSDAQPSTPQAIERPSTPEDREASTFEAPALKPLPGRAVSPSKSCLRSPLKTKTPGRVVEFTSSTLSPMAQAQARAEAQNQITTASSRSPSLSPRRSLRTKKNKPSALDSHIRSSPRHKHFDLNQQQQQQESVDPPLSQTRWSRKHWLLMDELLHAYRANPLDFQLRHSDAVMASPRKRLSSSLLGKVVTSQGEMLTLEQWHLDIVDVFKKEVGGWPEDLLAKRLFALIVGEARRKAGLVPRRR